MSPQPPKFLLSYWFGRKLDLDQLVEGMPTKPMLFADSGAYSAWTRGATIDRKDYAAWLKRWQHLITTAVNLDVIRDVDATHANQTSDLFGAQWLQCDTRVPHRHANERARRPC
jgi:hypothetical protein